MKTPVIKKYTMALLIILLTFSFSNKLDAQNKKKKKKEVVVTTKKPNSKYKNLPKYGAVVKAAPKAAVIVNPEPISHYYYGGLFYKPYSGSFIVVKPKIGMRVNVLPTERCHIVVNNISYYYYYGTFYINDRLNDDYVVTSPPIGAIVDAIPDGYEVKIIDEKEYLIYDNTWYKQVELENGEIGYKVVSEE